MFTHFEQPAHFNDLNEQANLLLTQIFEALPIEGSTKNIEGGFVFPSANESAPLYLIESGFVKVELDGKPLFFLEAGNLLGREGHLDDKVKVTANSPLVVREYDRAAFYESMRNDQVAYARWQNFVEIQLSLYTRVIAISIAEGVTSTPEVRHYEPGEPIIIEETLPKEVFTLLHGTAEVFVRDIKVGSVLAGEIFGGMSATTNTRRSASVIAKTMCVTSILPQDQFLHLVQTHPKTLHDLVSTMARVIVTQNEKILILEGKEEAPPAE